MPFHQIIHFTHSFNLLFCLVAYSRSGTGFHLVASTSSYKGGKAKNTSSSSSSAPTTGKSKASDASSGSSKSHKHGTSARGVRSSATVSSSSLSISRPPSATARYFTQSVKYQAPLGHSYQSIGC
jgi:hypothetical protein